MIRRPLGVLTRVFAVFALALPVLMAMPGIAEAKGSVNNGCPDKQIYFKFQYNFGNGGDVVDEGCWPKNDVYQTDIPSLIATHLHISCSDTISADGVPTKSDLGDPARRIVAYFILKSDGKTCGTGTPIPAGGVYGQGLFVVAAAGLLGVAGLGLRRRRNAMTRIDTRSGV